MLMRKLTRLKLKWLILGFALVAIAAVLVILFESGSSNTRNTANSSNKSKTDTKKPRSELPVMDLQPTVDAWAAKQSGTASVVVVDLANDKVVASHNANRQYFAASIYKLYVAYVGYQKVADGTYSLSDPYLSGYTRGECLDAMIRDSYSPCGEKMWNELGREDLTAKMRAYGLKDTSLTGLTTSAKDASIILKKLFNGDDLTQKYRKLYLDSMKTQPALYRRGLPSGFNDSVVYNKVGWNGLVEWHDASIVTLSNGRSYIVSVLTKNIGSKNIVSLARAIENKLSN